MTDLGIGIAIGILISLLNISLHKRIEKKGGVKNVFASSKAKIVEMRSPIEDIDLT